MTYRSVLLDTSAIVAIFEPDEDNHSACVKATHRIIDPMITSYPVLTEAHCLLRHNRRAQHELFRLAQSTAVVIPTLDDDFLAWVLEFGC